MPILARTTWMHEGCGWVATFDEPMTTVYCVPCFHGGRGANHICVKLDNPTRHQMLLALLHREDLLSSRDWPWTTDQLREAFDKLCTERPISEDMETLPRPLDNA